MHTVVCEVSWLHSLETCVLVLLRAPYCSPHEEAATTEHEALIRFRVLCSRGMTLRSWVAFGRHQAQSKENCSLPLGQVQLQVSRMGRGGGMCHQLPCNCEWLPGDTVLLRAMEEEGQTVGDLCEFCFRAQPHLVTTELGRESLKLYPTLRSGAIVLQQGCRLSSNR